MGFGLRLILGLNRLLCRVESFLLGFTLIVMLGFASLQVILRNFFDTGIGWGDVFARHLVLWVGFFGATLATNESRHIRIDALLKIIPKKWQPLVEVFGYCFCIVVGLLLMDAAYKFMSDEKMAATILFSDIPTWYFISIMPIGFALISFRYVVLLMQLLMRFAGIKVPASKVAGQTSASDDGAFEISLKLKIK